MDNASFSAGGECGEEIERALMDLGPLLGVTIKEETPDELADGAANRGNVCDFILYKSLKLVLSSKLTFIVNLLFILFKKNYVAINTLGK